LSRCSIVVTSPPPAETRARIGGVPTLKTMTSPLPHDAPRGTPTASVMVSMEPSVVSIRFNLPAAKNPIDRLSGDQNGINTSPVPDSGCDVNESSRRSQISDRPFLPVATNASRVPSGDNVAPLVPVSPDIPLGEPNEPSSGGSI
jgi:hypothetical protein